MVGLGMLVLSIIMMTTPGTVHSQITGSSAVQCSYTFYVSGQHQCTDQGVSVQRLEDQLSLLQRQLTSQNELITSHSRQIASQSEQITSLVRQNEELMQQFQENVASSSSNTGKKHHWFSLNRQTHSFSCVCSQNTSFS